jgi:uracil DNA glycosylase
VLTAGVTFEIRNLTSWANNGVLMLNTCLTVQAGQAGSHSKRGWERFTEKVVEVLDQYGGANLPNGPNGSTSTGVGRGIVFLAWGAWASERVSKLSKVCMHSSVVKFVVHDKIQLISSVKTPHSYECRKFQSSSVTRGGY